MIELHPDCLVFQLPGGDTIPCSAEVIAVKLLGEAADLLHHQLVQDAARAVLHYFKVEHNQTSVSVAEFSQALASVLRGFGLDVKSVGASEVPSRITESDLGRLACEAGPGFELAFFQRLRHELRMQLNDSPSLVRFIGLRDCVKRISGATRWTARCQRLNDQIVDYLRLCLTSEPQANNCALLVL